MTSSNPLRHASHAIPVAILSLLLLSAGMCQPAEEAPSVEASGPSDSAEVNEPAAAEAEIVEAGPSPAEIEEQERQAALKYLPPWAARPDNKPLLGPDDLLQRYCFIST